MPRITYQTTDHGRITSPGQFEGQMIYVPHFWEAYLNGCADRDDGTVLGFDITKEDRAKYPEIPARKRTIRLMQTDSGFVIEC